jgi:hypothetical protein
MYNNEFTTIRVQSDLSDVLEGYIKATKQRGIRKYLSKTDFVREACLHLMAEEEGSGKDLTAPVMEVMAGR